MRVYRAAVDRAAGWVVEWLGSRGAFLQIVTGTLVSIPLTLFAIDPHGFTYLYVATALSLVTQVPLAMIGQQARAEAQQAERASQRALDEIHAALELLQAQDGTHADLLRGVLALLETHGSR